MIKYTIEDCIKKAKSKGGLCLSETYVNARTKLVWRCHKNHIWKSAWRNINDGSWCPHCVGNAKLNIKHMHKLAKARGGRCLSDKYVNARTKLIWQCSKNHIWAAPYYHIMKPRWCARCSNSLCERICRLYFETLFDDKFPATRPEWLLNEEGYRLELDGFSSKLGIAFEHNGRVHYEKTALYSSYDFNRRKQNDDLKIRVCNDRGIKLFIIKELLSKMTISKLKHFILEQSIYFGLNVDISKLDNVNINKLYM